MGVTEPGSGTDTTQIKTTAVRRGDHYVVNGQKVWISRVRHSDWMILLARTTALAQVTKKSEGMSIFMVDLRQAESAGSSSTAALASRTNTTSSASFARPACTRWRRSRPT